jgi:DNA (cytosine-5)-methyltransferase 1
MTPRAAKLAAIGLLSATGLLVDVFAGFGGGSIASERAHGRPVNIAINHWPSAIEYHTRNHPHPTMHLTSDVREVDPLEATNGMPVLHAHFSPDCRHFSSAKGGQPVSDGVRALPWVVVNWAKVVRPTLITMENVKEFLTWGPTTPVVKNGQIQYFADGSEKRMPDPSRKGETFREWVAKFKALGYEIAWKVLDAADYGAPTHRRRLFLVARCDGNPVAWPEPTHGPVDKTYDYVRTSDEAGKVGKHRNDAESNRSDDSIAEGGNGDPNKRKEAKAYTLGRRIEIQFLPT